MAQVLKNEVRQRILDAALDLMIERGIAETDMRSIAKRAGVTPGNLYRYFSGRDEIIVCVTKPLTDTISDTLFLHTGGALRLDGSELGLHFLQELFKSQERLFDTVTLIASEAVIAIYKEGLKSPKIMTVLLCNNVVSDELIAWFEAVMKSGFNLLFEPKVDPRLADALVTAVVHSMSEGVAKLLLCAMASPEIDFESALNFYVRSQVGGMGAMVHELISKDHIRVKF